MDLSDSERTQIGVVLPSSIRFNFVVGGSIGNDPYDPRTWSGSALHFVSALKQIGALEHAFGLQLARWQDAVLKAKNFGLSRSAWRLKFYLDPSYRHSLTNAAITKVAALRSNSPFLQIGAMYSVPTAVKHKVPCFSYHDGNIVELLKSGYGFQGVPSRRIDAAIKYETAVAREMNLVFTFSEYSRRSFIENFGLNEKQVINAGAGVNIPVPDVAEKNYENGNILFVGVDFERKGGRELLAAFRILRETSPHATLHIVGPHQLPADADRPGILFHGNLSKSVPTQRDRLYKLYQEASVFVLPSKYEPFGIAPLEAMLFEVPCIVTNAWALREFVTHGVNGALVEKDSVDSLVAAMRLLITSPQELAAMGKSARAVVLKDYVWPNVARKMRAAAALTLEGRVLISL